MSTMLQWLLQLVLTERITFSTQVCSSFTHHSKPLNVQSFYYDSWIEVTVIKLAQVVVVASFSVSEAEVTHIWKICIRVAAPWNSDETNVSILWNRIGFRNHSDCQMSGPEIWTSEHNLVTAVRAMVVSDNREEHFRIMNIETFWRYKMFILKFHAIRIKQNELFLHCEVTWVYVK